MEAFDVIKNELTFAKKLKDKAALRQKLTVSELCAYLLLDYRSNIDEEFDLLANNLPEWLDKNEYADFAEKTVLRLGEKIGRPLDISDFVLTKNDEERIACVKSRYSELAYKDFSGLFVYPTVRYEDSTDSVIFSIASGDADFGILPTEDSRFGVIPEIYSQFEEHGVFEVKSKSFVQSDNRAVVFSLIAKAFDYPKNVKRFSVTFSFFSSDRLSSSDVLTALSSLGAEIRRVNFDEKAKKCTVSFLAKREVTVNIFAYLNLFLRDSSLYKLMGEDNG